MRGIVVCVDYDDLLEITLKRNARFMDEILVVTAPHDERTLNVVSRIPNARCHITDVFYKDGAKFNKGAAMEEGFDVLGRDGWILIHDADILLPDTFIMPQVVFGRMYSANRLMLNDPRQWTPDFDWSLAHKTTEFTFPGFFQLFNCADPSLITRPWYDTKYVHAGGGDHYFQGLWPSSMKSVLPITVLHLGPRDMNWFGRVSTRRDNESIEHAAERARDMEHLKMYHGWSGRPKSLSQFREKIT